MKRLLSIIFIIPILLSFGLMSCKKAENPLSAIYTQYGKVEIITVEEAKEYSGDINRCIRVRVAFINNTKNVISFSAENLICYYGDEITDAVTIEDAIDSLPPTDLNPNISTVGNVYFYIPNDIETIRIECTTEQGIAIFSFTIKDN